MAGTKGSGHLCYYTFMRVIGIDPGYDRLGVAIIEMNEGRETVIYSCCIETDKHLSLPERHKQVGDKLQKILQTYNPEVLGIETLFFNKNVKTGIGVAEARGVILYVAQTAQCRVLELSPQQIKIAVTGYGKSDKPAVIEMVKRLAMNIPKKALDDEYDAIAVGIATLAHLR